MMCERMGFLFKGDDFHPKSVWRATLVSSRMYFIFQKPKDFTFQHYCLGNLSWAINWAKVHGSPKGFIVVLHFSLDTLSLRNATAILHSSKLKWLKIYENGNLCHWLLVIQLIELISRVYCNVSGVIHFRKSKSVNVEEEGKNVWSNQCHTQPILPATLHKRVWMGHLNTFPFKESSLL